LAHEHETARLNSFGRANQNGVCWSMFNDLPHHAAKRRTWHSHEYYATAGHGLSHVAGRLYPFIELIAREILCILLTLIDLIYQLFTAHPKMDKMTILGGYICNNRPKTSTPYYRYPIHTIGLFILI
jgi:hypothetical protein